MHVLVTGGAGFIGSNYIRHMLATYPDVHIVNLDALTYAGNRANLASVADDPRYTFVHGDICDAAVVEPLVARADVVVHFAAESHVDRSIADSAAFVRTNVLGTLTLLEAAKNNGNTRFHHVSTDEVFGSLGKDDPAFTEHTPYDPRSPYSASKASSDHLVRAYFHTHNLPVTISNCSNNYGPYQFPEKLIPLFVTNLIDGKKVPVYGTGDNVRDWLHVTDHCSAIDAVVRRGTLGETYCVGGNAERTNMQITKIILDAFGVGEEMIDHVADRKGHDKRYAINNAKITTELGWSPSVPFEQGIIDTIQWYRDNEQWWRDIQSGAYRQQ